MGTTLNRDAYRNMIAEDLEWLLSMPRTLERDHIRDIVKRSEMHEYDDKTREIASLCADHLTLEARVKELEAEITAQKEDIDKIMEANSRLQQQVIDLSVPVDEWCKCSRWQAGAWKALKNYNKMNYCVFCGEPLNKSQYEAETAEATTQERGQ